MNEARLAQQRREDALDEVLLFVDLAISRSRASRLSEPWLKALIRGTLEAARQELLHLRNDADETLGLPAEHPQYGLHPEERIEGEGGEDIAAPQEESLRLRKSERRLEGAAG